MTQLSTLSNLQLQQHNASIANTHTAYWEGGDLQKAPMVFLHGLAGSHHGLMLLGEYFTDCHIFMPDLPGHGESAVPEHADAQVLADWFSGFLRFVVQQTGQKPIVVAHSFGSQIAVMACQQNAHLFTRCVLLNPVPHVSIMPRLFQQSLAFVPHVIAHRLGGNQHTQYWRNFYLLVRRDAQSIARMQWVIGHGINHSENFAFYINLSRQLMNLATYTPALGKSGVFFCIVGDTDRMINNKTLDYLQRIFGKKHFAICKRTGHLMPIEAPQETAVLIKAAITS